jgi:hypothetical protein
MGAKDKDGYGVFRARAISQSNIKSHRISALWAGIISDLDDGSLVCHSCDNPSCVNPDHLWRGTSLDNAKDRDAKGRGHYGGRHPMAKLTENDVRYIKAFLAAGANQRVIAKNFGVSYATISYINTGKTWSHVKVTARRSGQATGADRQTHICASTEYTSNGN